MKVTAQLLEHLTGHQKVTGCTHTWTKIMSEGYSSVVRASHWSPGYSVSRFSIMLDPLKHALVPWFFGTLVPWYFGTLVLWYLGTLVPWFFGTLVLWYLGSLVPWFLMFLSPNLTGM